MDTIRLTTWINAPVERCFLLSLSIDLHVASVQKTQEGEISGGLIDEGETVTFHGYDMRRWQPHTSRVDVLRPFSHFRDVMVSGPFRQLVHDHHFAPMDDGTRMRDEIRYSSLWWPLGGILARRRLRAFLMKRNSVIKRVAESEEWRRYLVTRAEVETNATAKVEAAPRPDRKVLLPDAPPIVAQRPLG